MSAVNIQVIAGYLCSGNVAFIFLSKFRHSHCYCRGIFWSSNLCFLYIGITHLFM